jgi:hypothetical protein
VAAAKGPYWADAVPNAERIPPMVLVMPGDAERRTDEDAEQFDKRKRAMTSQMPEPDAPVTGPLIRHHATGSPVRRRYDASARNNRGIVRTTLSLLS